MSAEVQQGKPLHEGILGIVHKNRVDQRYFVLYLECLDFYGSADDFETGADKQGRLALADIEELDVLDDGFTVTLAANPKPRTLELRVPKEEELQTWVDKIVPFLDEGEEEEDKTNTQAVPAKDPSATKATRDEAAKRDMPQKDVKPNSNQQLEKPVTPPNAQEEEREEYQEEVLLDADVQIELQGRLEKRHLWLTTDSFEYTENEEEGAEACESFPLEEVVAVTGTATGFSVQNRKNKSIVVHCSKGLAEAWVRDVQDAIRVKLAPKVASASNNAQNPANSGSAEGKPQQPVLAPVESSLQDGRPQQPVVAPVESSLQGGRQQQPVVAPVESSLPGAKATNAGYPQIDKDVQGKPAAQSDLGANGKLGSISTSKESYVGAPTRTPPLCQGELGICQKGREDRRYFVLFPRAFKYWGSQESHDRSEEPRGHVLMDQIVRVQETETGFTVEFAASNFITLRCNTTEDKNTWLGQWRKITTVIPVKVTTAPEKMNTTPLEKSNGTSSNNSGGFENRVSAFGTRVDAVSSNPPPSAVPSNLTPYGVIISGNLMIDRKVRRERRHFALFQDRLDYFGLASDMIAGRNPRGRIWLRDIQNIDVQGTSCRVNLKDSNMPKLVLIAEATDFPLWIAAWKKLGVECGGRTEQYENKDSRSVSPFASSGTELQSSLQQPQLRGAVIEGQFKVLRVQVGGVPKDRHFVLFKDRLDYFADAAAARQGRALESFKTKDIEWIDVVDGGFDITVAGRPYKLLISSGVLSNWVDALLHVFGERDAGYFPRS